MILPMQNVWLSRYREPDRPDAVIRVLGPDSKPEVARRLLGGDGTVTLVAVPLSTLIVAPATHKAVAWLQDQAQADRTVLRRGWSVPGRAMSLSVAIICERPDIARSCGGGHHRPPACRAFRRLPFGVAGTRSAGDEWDQGDRSERPGLDDPGRVARLVARRVVSDRTPLRLRDGFVSVVSWRFGEHWDAASSPTRCVTRWNVHPQRS